MARKNDSWGIEIGANALKAIRLVRTGSRTELTEYDILPFKQILTTPDLNVEEAIQVNLDTFLSKHDVSKSTVVVSVPGWAGFTRFAKLPPVEPKKIPDIVRFEAVQQIPFPIDQVEWDYQVFQHEDSPDVEVGIFAITKERVAQYLNNYRRVDMRVDGITMSPLAVYNAFAYESQNDTEPEGTIYLDIGTSSTDMIVSESDGIWMRTLPIGGNNFTEALVRSFKLSYPKAERLKREAGTSKYARQIFQAMRPVFSDLVQELQRSIGYYQSMHRESRITKLVGVGSTFRLPGLQKYLKQQLQMEVTRPQGFNEVEIEGRREAAFSEHAMTMCAAYGLALQGLGEDRITANLLPRQIQLRRMWKAKEPWVAAAAACVVAASGIAGGSLFTAMGARASSEAEYSNKIESVIQEANRYRSQWSQQKGQEDPRDQIEVLRGMLDYRKLWPRVIEDITQVAMSVDPPQSLLTASYDEAMQIPREQRNRLYIESVEVEYLVNESAGGMQGYQPGQNIDAATFWPDQQGQGFGSSSDGSSSDQEGESEAPRFKITLTGTTPYAEATSLINNRVIRWLQNHTDRPDRPYRLVVSDEPDEVLPSMVRLDRDEAGDTSASRSRASRTRSNTSPSGMRDGSRGLPPGMSDDDTTQRFQSSRNRSSGRDRAASLPEALTGNDGEGGLSTLSFAELYPTRALDVRPKQGDWRFQLTWTVQLLPPTEAQIAERGGGPQQDGADDQQDGQPQQDQPDQDQAEPRPQAEIAPSDDPQAEQQASGNGSSGGYDGSQSNGQEHAS